MPTFSDCTRQELPLKAFMHFWEFVYYGTSLDDVVKAIINRT